MLLEEEIVFQFDGGKDRESLSDRIDALKSLGFKVDDNKINAAIERYEVISRYKNKGDGRSAIRARKKEKLNMLTQLHWEQLKERNSNYLFFKVADKKGEYLIDTIRKLVGEGYWKCRKIDCRGVMIEREIKITGTTFSRKQSLFKYCPKCGHTTSNFDIY